MKWKINNANASYDGALSAAAKAKFNSWAGKIDNDSKHPKTAAEEVGDMHYEQLSGQLKGQYTVRVDGANRIAFTIVTSGPKKDLVSTVEVFQIGGHYPKKKK